MLFPPRDRTSVAVDAYRLEKTTSWFFAISLTMSGEETTTVGTRPKWRSMRGPYFSESDRRDRSGCFPIWWRFPIIGKPGGDGGKLRSFGFDEEYILSMNKRRSERRRRETEEKKDSCSSCNK